MARLAEPTGRFSVTLRMGNDAMSSPRDVAHALRAIAAELDDSDGFDTRYLPVRGNVRDLNGNTVGGWVTGADGLELLAEWF